MLSSRLVRCLDERGGRVAGEPSPVPGERWHYSVNLQPCKRCVVSAQHSLGCEGCPTTHNQFPRGKESRSHGNRLPKLTWFYWPQKTPFNS
jgi:hypothetical protein